jgi:hypothetical protein
VPECAAPVPLTIAATKPEEAEIVMQYVWQENWPIKVTVAIMMDVGTVDAFELSATYDLEKVDQKPTLEILWILMSRAIVDDGIILPDYVSRDRSHYAAICQKTNQSIQVIWRQKPANGTTPRIPEDQGPPVYAVYGATEELRLRDIDKLGCGAEGIVRTLYAGTMVFTRISSTHWAYIAAMVMEGEEPRIPEEVLLQQPNIQSEEAREYNQGLRESRQIVQNVDKGFAHYIKYFRQDQEVVASMQIERGRFGEVGWGVFCEQGRYRCMLAGTVSGRPEEEIEEDALWVACAEWANFEPVVGKPKIHKETFHFSEACTHFFERGDLSDLSEEAICQSASEFRKGVVDRFCEGVRKFVRPFELFPLHEAPLDRTTGYVLYAASSRRFQIADGADLWTQGCLSFAPAPSQTVAGTVPDPGSLSPPGEWLVQFEFRVLGRPGEAGSG